MTSQQIHALLIEDDPDDILLLKESLAEIGLGRIKLDYTDRLSRGLIQLGSGIYDVILLDLNLPDSRGLDTLSIMVKRFPKIPVVILSGLADDAITIEAVRRGAQDYLVKGEISGPLVMRVVRYAIERKQVEAVLRSSEARYRTLVDTSPNGITLADLEGKLLLCNQQAARLFGFNKPEAMLGFNFFKFVALADRQQAALNIHKALSEGKVTHTEYTLLRNDGSEFPGEISTAMQYNSAGAPTGFICITRDITEHKKAIEAEKQLVMLEKEFISSVSRELRAPLLSLMEYLNRMRSNKMTDFEVLNDLLMHASMDSNQLLDMVNELLDFSLLENELLTLNWEHVDLGKLILDILQSSREQANARRISLMSAPMDTPLIAYVDPERMRRVVLKLVENALNFSGKDSTVLVTGKSMNGKVVINVIDEGSGISLEECSRIFDKYYQVDLPQQRNTSGTGVGLYIAKQIAEAHGGTLTMSSQLGAGSTFTLTIPVEKKSNS